MVKDNGSGLVDNGSGLVDNGSGLVDNGSGLVDNGGICLIIVYSVVIFSLYTELIVH